MSTLNPNPTIQKLSICMMGVKTNFPLHRLSSLFCVRISGQHPQWVQIFSEIALSSSCDLQLNKIFFQISVNPKIFFAVKAYKNHNEKGTWESLWFRGERWNCNSRVSGQIPGASNLKKLLKFMFSKKATKIDKIFTVNLTVCSNL